ncbi:MAG TPA: hypothetical protein VN030_01465, partial [Cellvibrio sp.]|nr:hypothetical protein [Cellvibrio sp.]
MTFTLAGTKVLGLSSESPITVKLLASTVPKATVPAPFSLVASPIEVIKILPEVLVPILFIIAFLESKFFPTAVILPPFVFI